MHSTPLILLGSFISSWIWLIILFYLLEIPNEFNKSNAFLAATIIAPFIALFISLPVIILTDFTQSFQKKPVKAVLLATIVAVVGLLILPYLYLVIPILLFLAVFLAVFYKDRDMGMDIKNVASWANELLLKSFEKAKISNGDRFIIFVEVEKRGLTKDLKIKSKTVIFKISDSRGNRTPLWVCCISLLLCYLLSVFGSLSDNIGVYICLIVIGLLSLLFYLFGGLTSSLIITNSTVVVKKTIFNIITMNSKQIPITTHNNNGLYFSTSLVYRSLHKSEVALGVIFTFKRVPMADEKISYCFLDDFYNALPTHNKPLKNSKNNLLGHSMVMDFLNIIPKNLSQLLLIRKVPFFCEHMPSGNPIFDDDQLPSSDICTSRSVCYEIFSLIRPTIELSNFKSFCETLTLPSVLTKATLDLYDLDWLRILFFVQKGAIPPLLLNQDFTQKINIEGDYIFSIGTQLKKIKSRVVFGTKGISLAGADGIILKSCSYSEVEIPVATANEVIFDLNLTDHPLKLSYNGSLPFKQLIKQGNSTN